MARPTGPRLRGVLVSRPKLNRLVLVEQLSDAVHRAWMAEKQAQGFADHVYHGVYQGDGGMQLTICTRCPRGHHEGTDKHHPDMLPYADLPENVKEYDRVTVRAVLLALDEAGYEITRRADPERRPRP